MAFEIERENRVAIVDVELAKESEERYLTYALSVVSSRALPDVRDGLKPVQRRILYAMMHDLSLAPEKAHRKSATVIGEVLGSYHPHGDSACYEALVRMAQDFSLRYPLIDGQGNFGSLDGDAAAAYRYTEARLSPIALEVIGDVGQETVAERDNFDQTKREPVVLPSRVPNLLINGASGIAVGMATAIPPHNLREVVKALVLLLESDEVSDAKLCQQIKGPDFPTGCQILNTTQEMREIYSTGRGTVRMRSTHKLEDQKGKQKIIITSIPYAVDKSNLVEKIADLIIARKVPQLVDVRDESTDEIRVVLELAPSASAEKALAYLYKNTPLQQNFYVNLTALVPTSNPMTPRPALLPLRDILNHFVRFRIDVTRCKLLFEKRKLEERIHLLDGLVQIYDVLDEVIKIVRKSEGRADAASKLCQRFKLTEVQALFIVDLRIYQLSKTSIEDVEGELKEKKARVAVINKIVSSEANLKIEVATDLKRISEEYGDDRRSTIVSEFEELEIDHEEYMQHEEVFVVVTKDGWLKRIRSSNDPETTRIREGDAIFFLGKADTRDTLLVFSTLGNLYTSSVYEVTATSGFGDPVQKLFRFEDGEQIASCLIVAREESGSPDKQVLLYSRRGLGFRLSFENLVSSKKGGKRLMKLADGDTLSGVCRVQEKMLLLLSAQGYAVYLAVPEVPVLSGASKGVILQKLPKDDELLLAKTFAKGALVKVRTEQGPPKEIPTKGLGIMNRATRGLKLIKRGLPIEFVSDAPPSGESPDSGKGVQLRLV